MNIHGPLTDRQQTFKQVQRMVKAKTHFRKFLPPIPKIWCVKKSSNLRQFIEDGRKHVTSKHINMWTNDYGTKLGAVTPLGLSAT